MPYFGNDTSVLDRRILRMEFDNQKFEKNIAKSQKSVEDFKKVMNFDDTTRGLERFSEAANHISFDRMESYLERLADKFTGIGDAGEYMVSRVRSAIEGMAGKVESFAKSLSLDQINVGQSKYDALNKAVMTITATGKYTEEQAYKVFERLMTYTDETSYSFADMVNQISAFTAAGQSLGSAEKAMEGIANATAKAGQGTAQATAAMQTFAKVMGSGHMDLNKWNSLMLTSKMITEEFRQVLVDTAVEEGTLTKQGDVYRIAPQYRSDAAVKAQKAAEDAKSLKGKNAAKKAQAAAEKAAEYERKAIVQVNNLETTLHNKWLTAEVVMKALEKYYFDEIDNPDANWDTFAGSAAKAAQRALSLTDALNAMKEAVSGGWMTTFQLFWGNVSEAMVTFTNIANRAIEVLEKIGEWRNRILRTWADIGGRTSFIRTILGDYGQDVTTGAIGIVDLLEKAGDFIATGLKNFFKIFVPAHLRQYWDDEGFQESFFSGMLYSITNSVTNFFTTIDDFFNGNVITGTGEAKTRLQVFEEIVDGILGVFSIGYNVISSVVSFIQDVAVQLAPSFDAITMFFSELGLALYGAAEDTNQFQPLQVFFHELTEIARPLTSGINSLISAFTEMLGILVGATDKSDVLPKVFGFIGNAIKFVSGVIVNYGTPILRFFTAIFESIGNVIQNGISGNGFSGIFNSVKTAVLEWSGAIFDVVLKSIPQGVQDRISGIFQVVRSFISPIIDLITEVFSTGDGNLYTKVSNWFTRTIKKVTDFFSVSNIDRIKSKIIEWGKRFASVYEYIKQQIVEKSESIIDWIKDKISSIDFKLVGIGALIVIAVSHIGEFVSNLFSIFRKQRNASGSSSSVDLGSFLRVINNVVLIVGAIMILHKLPWDKIENSFAEGSIGQKIIHMFKGLIDLLSEIDWWSVIVRAKSLLMELNIARFIYAISSAKLSMAKLMKSISSLIKDGLSVKISKPKDTAGSILKIAEALGIMVVSIIALANMPWDKARNSFYMILGVMTALGVFVAGLKGIFKGLDPKVAISITGIVFAVDAMIFAMIPLAFIPWQRLTQGLIFLGLIMVELYSFARGISNLGGIGLSKDSLNGAIGLAGAIAILTAALLPIGFIKWSRALQIVVVLGAVLQILGAFAVKLKTTSTNLNKESLNGAIGLAGAIAILMGVLLPLGFASAKGIAKMLITFGGILAILAGFAVIINKFGSNGLKKDNLNGAVKLALAISLLMGVFTAGLLLTQNVNWKHIAAFAGGLSVIIIATAAALVLLSKVDFVRGILGIALLSAAVAAIVGVLGLLTPWLIDQAASGLQQAGGKLVNSGDMIVKFASIMTSVGDDSMDHAIGIINKLKDVMLSAASISGLSGSISNFTTNLFDLGLTVKNFASDLSEAGGAGNAIDLINRLSGTANGLERLSKISLTGFTTTLTGLGGAMDVYAAGATSLAAVPAGDDKKASTAKAIEILEELSQGLIEHGAFQIPTNLPDTQEIGVFGGQLAALAIAMVKFEKAGRDLGDGTDNAIKSIGMLSEIEKKLTLINDIDKLVNFFTGNKDKPNVLTEFAKNIRLLGGALADFAKSTTIADEKTGEAKPLNFDAATKTLQALGKIETDLSQPETLIEWFTGVTSQLNVLAGDIQSMSVALTAFQGSATELEGKEASRQEALDAIKTFVEFFNGTKDKEGLAPKIKELYTAAQATDDNTHLVINTITQLSDDMGTVGTNLSTYGTELKKVDFKKEKSNQEAALASMSAFIEVVGTIESKISEMNASGSTFAAALQFDESGKNVVTVLSETMAIVGKDLNTFGTKIGEVDFNAEEGNQAAALEALSNFVDYSNELSLKLPKVKSIAQQIADWLVNGGQLTIEDMAAKMGSVGESLGKFGEGIKNKFNNVGVDEIQVVLAAIQGFADILTHMEYLYSAEMITGASPIILADNVEQFIMALSDGVSSMDGKTVAKTSLIEDLVNLMVGISAKVNKMNGFNAQAITSFRDLAQALVFVSQVDTEKNFVLIGQSISEGVAKGIIEGEIKVLGAGTGLIDKLVEVVKDRAKVASPSKVFAELGMYLDQGLALGVTDNTWSVIEAVAGMSGAAIDSASGIIAEVSRALAEDTNASPTITPVLDLTGVANGLRYIDGQMYDRGFGIDVSGQAAFASRINGLTSTSENQNGTLDLSGVYSHIDQLGTQIVEMGEQIKNLQFVLDTGALAGAVTDKIDKNLGLKAFYVGRRN